MLSFFNFRWLPGIIIIPLMLIGCSLLFQRNSPSKTNAESILEQVESPTYDEFKPLPWQDYERFYQRSQFYFGDTNETGPHPVAIMAHGCGGVGGFYPEPPTQITPDDSGRYTNDGGIHTYLNTYANFFGNHGIIPYVVDSNGPRENRLVEFNDRVISCYDTLEEKHATYIPTRLEDIRRAVAYLAYRSKKAGKTDSSMIYPDLNNIYIIGWSQGAETILRFSMAPDYRDGANILHTMESPFARIPAELRPPRLNLIGVYPAAGHLLRRSEYLQESRVVNTAIFIGTNDDFYTDVRSFQRELVDIPGIHHYREFPGLEHSYDKDDPAPENRRAAWQTRKDILEIINATRQF